ncbi:MAG: threonylcarbamoyl-AMP synthase [Clostridia bacterium]|nr:threonylcarbamoyl-AMP synthase [Clostridia bacterium]
MTTTIYPPCENSLSHAAQIIKRGGLVAFPTETVYGLGANALDDLAVKKIFEVKGRPGDNPLICHVHPGYDIGRIVSFVPPYAEKLKAAFVPGPLTMVYKSCGAVSSLVSAGLDTLAVRVPSHPLAQKFLELCDLPVAAPSANVSKHVSPVTAQHVVDDLDGKIECVLDGGKCAGGIESTVIDCTGEFPIILREGLVTRRDIEKVTGRCDVHTPKEGEKVRSPGMKYRHYSPNCPAYLFHAENLSGALKLYDELAKKGKNPVLLTDEKASMLTGERMCVSLGSTDKEAASSLYGALREAEKSSGAIIAVEPSLIGGVMDGVLNRLKKACGGKYVGQ